MADHAREPCGHGQWRGHAVLEIPVPRLEPFVRARTLFYDPSFLGRDERFCHAHITLLAPFPEPPEPSIIGQLVAGMTPFDFRLERLAVFPNGVVHLVPEPEAPFRQAIRACMHAFPGIVPYGGDDPAPHLTLDALSRTVSVASTRALLGDLVPARCRAERVDLCWYEANACRVLQRWDLE